MAGVNVVQNDGVLDFSELAKVFLQAFFGQLEVQTTHKDLALGVSEGHLVVGTFRVVDFVAVVVALAFMVHDHVRVWLLDLLTTLGDVHFLAVISMLEVLLTMSASATAAEVAAPLRALVESSTSSFRLAALVVFS